MYHQETETHMSDKVENAVEKSDQYHEMLMKPVTVANHKQMEKTVDAAIAHAKRVGDDDLLELAEEIGREILALRSRASRLGAKATMGAPSMQEVRSRLAWIEKNIDSAEQSLRSASKQGKFQECHGWCKVIAAEFAKLGATYLQWDAAAKALNASRPGAKAKMSLPNISELQKIVNKLIERGAYYASLEYKPAEKRRVVKGHQQDTRLLNDLLAAVQANNGAKAKATLAKIDPVLRAVLPKDTKAWASQHSRPGAKATFTLSDVLLDAMSVVKNDEPSAGSFVDEATKAMTRYRDEMTANDRDWLLYKKLIALAERKGIRISKPMTLRASRPGAKFTNALSDACWQGYEAVGTKEQDGKTVPNCVPKATAAKPDDTEREDVKAGLKIMSAADPKVSDKIRTLIKEGKPQDQAVAIALDMKRRGEL